MSAIKLKINGDSYIITVEDGRAEIRALDAPRVKRDDAIVGRPLMHNGASVPIRIAVEVVPE